jgi:hypothetical protein
MFLEVEFVNVPMNYGIENHDEDEDGLGFLSADIRSFRSIGVDLPSDNKGEQFRVEEEGLIDVNDIRAAVRFEDGRFTEIELYSTEHILVINTPWEIFKKIMARHRGLLNKNGVQIVC